MSKQYELSILRQALQDIKLRVGEMEEWLNESNEGGKDKREIKAGDKVLVMRGNRDEGCLDDDIYTILGRDGGGYKVKESSSYILVPECYETVQPLLSGPFDASRIPKDKVPGYMVWDNKHKSWVTINSTRHDKIEMMHPVVGVDTDGALRAYTSDGFHNKGEKAVALMWQPPEKLNAEPSDELLLRVIEEMPWVVEWCRSGKCENGAIDSGCPHNSTTVIRPCPTTNSICFKLFGTFSRNEDGECCPCYHHRVGEKKVQSVKSRIVTLAEEKRTYKVGDCFEEVGTDTLYIFSGHDEDWRLVALGSNYEFSNRRVGKEDARRGVHLDRLTKDPSLLTYLGPFDEVFSRKI